MNVQPKLPTDCHPTVHARPMPGTPQRVPAIAWPLELDVEPWRP